MANPGMRHAYKSAKADPVDTTLIGATKWNDRHYFLEDDGTTASGALGDLPYRGTSGLITLLTGAQGVLTSAGAGNVPAWSMSPTLTTLTLGTTPAASGVIRLANAGNIVGRNVGNTADIEIARVNSSNYVQIDALGSGVMMGSASFASISFGGVSSSFPALVRSGAILQTKLADDSAHATHSALTFKTMTALVALGGGAAPTLGTIGGSGPATAAQNTWLRMIDSTGAAFWVPVWK